MPTHAAERIVVDDVSKRSGCTRTGRSSLKEMITRRAVSRYDEFWALRDVVLRRPAGVVPRADRPQRVGEVDAAAG